MGDDIIAYVYMIKNKINNKMYIGSSVNYKRRWSQHKWYLNNGNHANKHLQNAWNKYGKENFVFKVIEECKDELQFEREQYYIDRYNPFSPNGYNISANAGIGIICEKEYKDKHFSGEKHPNATITNEEVVNIKKLLSEGFKAKEISKTYGYKMNLVCQISNLCKWVNVGTEYNDILKKIKTKRISEDTIVKAVELKKEGYTYKEIGEKLNVNGNSIRNRCDRYLHPSRHRKCVICGKEIIQKSKKPPKYCKDCAKKVDKERSKIRRANKISV